MANITNPFENFSFWSPADDSINIDSSLNNFMIVYIFPPLCLVSLVLSLANFFILSHRQFRGERLFVYLKLASLFSAVDLLFGSLYVLPNLKNSSIARTYFTQFIQAYVNYDLNNVLEKMELVCTCLAAYSYFKMINELSAPRPTSEVRWCSSNNPYFVISILLAFTLLTSAHQLFGFQVIASFDVTTNATSYEHRATEFADSVLFRCLEITSYSLINGLLVVILICMDLFIVLKIRSSLNREMRMTAINS
jgi:hypothetical protein